jgi:hypothetical protein
MLKSAITAFAACGFVLSVSCLSAQAGGGGASAPSKYTNVHVTVAYQTQHRSRVQNGDGGITEFSSSSARSTGPKR